jgi:glucose-1-phosphate cytidylyltransferase
MWADRMAVVFFPATYIYLFNLKDIQMKVVLFCGGLGTRMRGGQINLPKPLVNIGYRPILWHLMRYYAHFGHKDFILCLGYKADAIKNYFLNYDERLSNDFILSGAGTTLVRRDIQDWRITFVDTGLHSNIGQRLKAVEPHLDGEEIFLANYADGLTDLYLPEYLNYFSEMGRIGCFLCVRPNQSFHVVSSDGDFVQEVQHITDSSIWVNGGFFIFRREIFDYIEQGEELVEQPFTRLIRKRELLGYKHYGFWASMDTFKEWQRLEDLFGRGSAPWEVWKTEKIENIQPVKV